MKKEYRIKKNQEFQSIIDAGKKKSNDSFVAYYQPKKDDQARVGITLSKKMGNAVERNHYKRQVRMMCQEILDFQSYPNDIILIVRKGYKNNRYSHNKNNLEKLLLEDTIK